MKNTLKKGVIHIAKAYSDDLTRGLYIFLFLDELSLAPYLYYYEDGDLTQLRKIKEGEEVLMLHHDDKGDCIWLKATIDKNDYGWYLIDDIRKIYKNVIRR